MLTDWDRRYRRAGHVTWTEADLVMVWAGVVEHVYTKPKGPNKIPSCGNSFHDPRLVTVYDPVREVWGEMTTAGDVPPPTAAPAAATDSCQTLFVFGGLVMRQTVGGYYQYDSSASLYSLDLGTRQWTLLRPGGDRPPPSEKGVSWHHGDTFYVFGGFCWDGELLVRGRADYEVTRDGQTGGAWHNALTSYSPRTRHYTRHTLTGHVPCARAGAAACVTDNKVFIFGGRSRQRRLNDLFCIDLQTMTSTAVHLATSPDMFGPPSSSEPSPRSLHSLTSDGAGRLVVYGGLGQLSAPLNDCWLLELDTLLWQEQDLGYDHGEVRCWHSAVLIKGEILVHSGLTQEHYLTRLDLDDHCQDILRLIFGASSLQKLALDSVIDFLGSKDQHQITEMIESLPSMLKKSVLTRYCKNNFQASETDTETDYSRSRLHSGI